MEKTILFIVILFCQVTLFGQQNTSADSLSTTTVVSDSTTTSKDAYGIFSIFKGNPGNAALYSLVLPSAGQIYNKRYWKVPIVLAAEGTAIYFLVKNINTFKTWDDRWKSLANGIPIDDLELSDINNVKSIRDEARTQKDNQWLIVLGIHLIVTADAFIDRHLIEFDVSDDLSFKLNTEFPGIGLVYGF